MKELMTWQVAEKRNAPHWVIGRAKERNGQVMRLVWEAKEGYPAHAEGYVQWSVRPFSLGYGCDGTTDLNIHYLAVEICKQVGLDYRTLYGEAYGHERQDWDWFSQMTPRDWEEVAAETIVPDKVDDAVLCWLLHDLYEINNRSICIHLEEVLEARGHEVGEWHHL